jgi:peptide chain release factor 2
LRSYTGISTRFRSGYRAFGGIFEIDAKRTEKDQLERQINREDLWQEPKRAQELMRQRSTLQEAVERWEGLQKRIEEQALMLELAEAEEELSVAEEIASALTKLERDVAQTELARMLGGPDDEKNAILTIHAGAGGTESQDWAEMLLRMYLRWAERRGFEVEMKEASEGEEAGIKSASFIVKGENAYGLFAAERGVHRLVRISPFDAQKRRHTAFAQVDVAPLVDEEVELELNDEELRVDTYRASGAGGQHVNKTDSAVRVTHLPTGIVVQCQNERSQTQNKATAMRMLRARLLEEEERKRAEEMAAERGEQKAAEWGSQIRSYTLHPSTRVKDHRTGFEVGDAQRVLDGDLDGFVREYLNRAATG